VVFTLAGLNADFLYGIASRFAFILKEGTENPGVLGEGDDVFSNFIGTGPFVLAEYSAGERAFLTANENYWIEGQPMLGGIEFLFIDDSLNKLMDLLDKELKCIIELLSECRLFLYENITNKDESLCNLPIEKIKNWEEIKELVDDVIN